MSSQTEMKGKVIRTVVFDSIPRSQIIFEQILNSKQILNSI